MVRPAPQRILGVDPSLRASGLAVIEVAPGGVASVRRCQTVRNPPALSHAECLRRLWEALQALLDADVPSAAAIESLFFSRNVRTAIALGEVRGVILACCAAADVPVFEYAPRDVKRAVTGRGDASKEQVHRMVRALTGFDGFAGEDETDALAVALCHVQRAAGPAGGGGRRL